MLIDEYFQQIEMTISRCPIVITTNLIKEKRSPSIGFLEGRFTSMDGSMLHFVEFVNVKTTVDRYKYSYHYPDQQQQVIFRYDMAPHHKDVATFPHHKHIVSSPDALESNAPLLRDVLDEIERSIVQ